MRVTTDAIDLANPVNRQEPLNLGLKLWCRGITPWVGGQLFDLCGKFNGTRVNGAGWCQQKNGGRTQNAIVCDGTNDHLTFSVANNALGFGAASSDWTFAAWVYYTDTSTRGDAISYKGGAVDFGLILNRFGTDFAVYHGGDIHQWARTSGWRHVVITHLQSNYSSYDNGVLAGGPTGADNTISDNAASLYLGANAGASQFLNGAFDSIRIYPLRGFSARAALDLYRDECAGCPRTLNRVKSPVLRAAAAGGGFIDNTSNILRALWGGASLGA